MAEEEARGTESYHQYGGLPSRLTPDRLQAIVDAVCRRLADPELRAQSQRAIQAKVWHLEPSVSMLMRELKADELQVKNLIEQKVSALVYEFHSHTIDATLARAGITTDDRFAPPLPSPSPPPSSSSSGSYEANHKSAIMGPTADLDLRCLDAKERLYMLLQKYNWLEDFFRTYPHHFYENSFSFVSRIPRKPLLCKALVLGLGVGGSMACSGMAKHGIDVTGVEKRERPSSRYQNASWRAYDTAQHMVDDEAFQELVRHRQRIIVVPTTSTDKSTDDLAAGGTSQNVVTFSDRVQIVIGHAIETAIMSARRYGASLHIGKQESEVGGLADRNASGGEGVVEEAEYDLCAVFCGAHTSKAFPVLDLKVHSWPKLESTCKMWLQVQPIAKALDENDEGASNSCTRHGEIGAEHWHFTISSTRHSEHDLDRILYNLDSQYARIGSPSRADTDKYRQQRERVEAVLQQLRSKAIRSYEYTFTNAPSNPHNLAKREAARDKIAIDGGYSVPVQIATQSSFSDAAAQKEFRSKAVVCGGDATVPPNPLAAYGATLACEAAFSAVQLGIAFGHLNAILACMADRPGWCDKVQELKALFLVHYEARSRAENYFQFVQTLLCNLYSLPPQLP